MSKRLEQFIRENRSEFDEYEPGEKVWQTIEKKLPVTKRKTGVIIRWAAAASILILLASTAYYLFSFNKEKALSNELVNSGVPPEYADEVYHFTKLIELKHRELQKIEKEQPELYHQFAGDINKLDSNYQVLKKELPDNPNQEMLLEAMIGNLKWQIDLLNQQLTIIQKIKQTKKSVNEKSYKAT